MASCVTVVLVTAMTTVTSMGTVTTIVAVEGTERANSTICVLVLVAIMSDILAEMFNVTMATVDNLSCGVGVVGNANGMSTNRLRICGMTSVPFVHLRLLFDCNMIIFMSMSSVIVFTVCVTASTNIGVTVSTVVSVSVFTVYSVVMTAMGFS